ncbi:ATP-binding cassette domain-containing protein [Clostridium botulinum]|uniref:UvrABC system protein A n=1 Tax=Clostridium botulinum (strain Langeland / NCTC 10281 / Type F) TaxID=441772 RepID=A7GH42_CLOBL|nr:excinuclease ABC subunit UvrA [Clostridium botulinum]ABS42228.1 putative excinuclease ABC, A subunit [Clostridium botulinum F str. Langeland]ADG00484.1 putative excinuclease ABC, A subunit [Clostridium botulinum F str. 230613]KKM41016.1 daunorubicin resistance protein DrrC [Clostridium botulinum]MBY6792567.1 excinuclease ABC subunit UvrA [Clostridium botulinum]MBY6937791.1 excinuclease ABC subunit UvrA [Clostridium botulinum]
MDIKESIYVAGAREKNLKNIDIKIPKKKITVFTGVSGSGKSSLVFDTIAAESQRQLNETYSSFIRHRLPHYGQPDVDSIKNLSVAIIINQKRIGGNSRSTVGTITDIAPLLRLLFSRIGKPFVGYSDVFSFNNPTGMCMNCDGLGKVDSINIDKLLDKNKSLNEGAILFPTFKPGGWRLKRYIHSGLFDNDKKIKDYDEKELDLLLNKTDIKIETDDPDWPKTSLYEGLIPRIERSFLKKEGGEREKYKKEINKIVTKKICPVCKGARLNEKILSCKINGKNIADCTKMQINDLIIFMKEIKEQSVQTVLKALISRLEHLEYIGLGYLSLDRETSSLSGGESQRIKMVKQLGSSLTGLTYIFDEPSIGLHPHDIGRINKLLKMLRDKGNTVLIVEHDPDIIKIADYIIDMGPKAGIEGGNIVYKGTPEGLLQSNTLTGKALQYKPQIKLHTRKAKEWLSIKNANLHNLKNINVDIPKGVMTVVTGVAGSGKSTLINRLLPKIYPETIFIDQGSIHASIRSNIATYTGIFDFIRNLFAKENNVKSSLFSFNSEGACPECKGLGVTYTDLAFMDTVISTCEVCEGNRFTDKVLNFKFRGKNISQVLKMTVAEAIDFFKEDEIYLVLRRLVDVGIDYITLGQPLNTLSGGELQRLKLAAQLDSKGNIYVLDEPTTGLHISDITKLVAIMNRLVNQGSTLIVIEHNLDIITQADWIIDLGPEAGENGGRIMFEGEPKDIITNKNSITGKYLKRYIL